MNAPPLPSRNALNMLTVHRPRPSGILHFLQFIRTLSLVVGVTLGVASVFAAVWSKFLLPLLYSTFSARKAVTEQQLLAFRRIVESLKGIRAKGIYGPVPSTAGQQAIGGTDVAIRKEPRDVGSPDNQLAKITDSLLIEEITDDPHHTTSHLPTLSLLLTPSSSSALAATPSRLLTLPETLTHLELSMDATSTTRTSLLSTLSSFTSQLHTQSFQFATRSRGGYGAGLSSLDANLLKAGASPSPSSSSAGADTESTEGQQGEGEGVTVDDVKKEIRGLKGLLLSRREFPHMKR